MMLPKSLCVKSANEIILHYKSGAFFGLCSDVVVDHYFNARVVVNISEDSYSSARRLTKLLNKNQPCSLTIKKNSNSYSLVSEWNIETIPLYLRQGATWSENEVVAALTLFALFTPIAKIATYLSRNPQAVLSKISKYFNVVNVIRSENEKLDDLLRNLAFSLEAFQDIRPEQNGSSWYNDTDYGKYRQLDSVVEYLDSVISKIYSEREEDFIEEKENFVRNLVKAISGLKCTSPENVFSEVLYISELSAFSEFSCESIGGLQLQSRSLGSISWSGEDLEDSLLQSDWGKWIRESIRLAEQKLSLKMLREFVEWANGGCIPDWKEFPSRSGIHKRKSNRYGLNYIRSGPALSEGIPAIAYRVIDRDIANLVENDHEKDRASSISRKWMLEYGRINIQRKGLPDNAVSGINYNVDGIDRNTLLKALDTSADELNSEAVLLLEEHFRFLGYPNI